jgi:hypothetical protein
VAERGSCGCELAGVVTEQVPCVTVQNHLIPPMLLKYLEVAEGEEEFEGGANSPSAS